MRKNGIIFSFVRVSIALIIGIGAFLSAKSVQAGNNGYGEHLDDLCSGTKLRPGSCKTSPPIPAPSADPVELVGYGINAKDRYESLKNTPGWWNEDGDFTVEEFFGLWVLAEDSNTDLWGHMIANAIAQNLYVGGWNAPDCQIGQVCQNGAFNFMGRYSQMHDSLLSETNGYRGPQGQHDSQTMTNANAFGKEVFNTTSLVWDRYGAAANWGNYKYLPDALLTGGITPWNSGKFGSAKTTVNYTYQSFVVLSVNQYNYWHHERHIDMTLLSQ